MIAATGSEQIYTATATGVYQIVAYGAQGGSGYACGQCVGGNDAEIGGNFVLTAGEVLDLYVGEQGGGGGGGGCGGGGGGGGYSGGNAGQSAGQGGGSYLDASATGSNSSGR